MPIRTNRGRAAVYRRLWGWPLRSPKHLVAVGLFVLAVVMFLGFFLPRLTGGSSSADPDNTAATSTRTTTASPTPTQGAPGVVPGTPGSATGSSTSALPTATRQTPSENRTPAKADPKAIEAASKWAEAFMNHPENVTAEQWLEGMRPYTTDEYLGAKLSTIDPKSIPGTKVTGPPAATPESYTNSVTVEVPTDAKKLTVTVIRTTAGWRVNEHGEVG